MKALKNLIKQLGAARGRLIFISHPYANNPGLNKKRAMSICRYWWRKGFIPICPVVLFGYMENDDDRLIIMQVCKILILLCPGFLLYGQSQGCMEEYEFAKKHSRNIVKYIPEKEKINFKRMMEGNREVIL